MWIYHGESGYIGAHNCTANDDGYESDDSDDFELYQQSVFDMVGALVDDMGRTAGNKEDASGGLDIFKKLNEEAMKPFSQGMWQYDTDGVHYQGASYQNIYAYDQQDTQYALSAVEYCFA